MNISEASAVNTIARGMAGIPHPLTEQLPTPEQLQTALDILLRGAHRKLGAGLAPGDVQLPATPAAGADQ